MKILITGGTGFIGTHIIERLLQNNDEVHLIVRPSRQRRVLNSRVIVHTYSGNFEKLVALMKKENYDGIIHLASLFVAKHEPEMIKDLIESNVTLGTMLLEAATKASVPWFVNTGTFWQHYKNKKYSPVNLYAASKQAFEDIALYYTETTPITFVTIQLSDTFGKNDTRPKIFTLLKNLSGKGGILEMSPGEQILDITYVENIADGYMRMISLLSKKDAHRLRGKVFAIQAPKRLTLKELVRTFEKITKLKLSIIWGGRPYRDREVMVPWDKGTPIPGFKQKVSLKDGIRKTLDI